MSDLRQQAHRGYCHRQWKGRDHYQCLQCAYDTPDIEKMYWHRQRVHGTNVLPMPEYDQPLEDWVIQERATASWCKGLRVALGFLTWNQCEAHRLALEALLLERDRLEAFGIQTKVCWVDNGSTDDTWQTLGPMLLPGEHYGIRLPENQGSSVGRNHIIDAAAAFGADYLLFLDGDIEVIPYSLYAMLKVLAASSPKYASVGFEPSNCSADITELTSPDCRLIYPWMLDTTTGYTTAWTQYGMWRMEALSKVRFEERGPFGPGWGLEDDDLYMQLVLAGYSQMVCPWFHYLHRRLHSSVLSLGRQETLRIWDARKKFLAEKWGPYRGNRKIDCCMSRILGLRIDGMVASVV